MDNTAADIVLAYLTLQGHVTPQYEQRPWAGTLAALVDNTGDSDNAIAVSDVQGPLDGRANGVTVRHPGIQLRVRAADYKTGSQKCEALIKALDEITRAVVLLDGHQYQIQSATLTTDMVHLGPEENNMREHFTLNAILTITQLA